MIVLDTSVIVRAAVSPVTPDDRVMHATSSEFFRRAALGTELFTTSEAVLADVAHVLQKLYGVSRRPERRPAPGRAVPIAAEFAPIAGAAPPRPPAGGLASVAIPIPVSPFGGGSQKGEPRARAGQAQRKPP